MTSVYCGNLSWSVTDEDLLELMNGAGECSRAQVITYPDGRSKGWGLVEFTSPEAALEAIEKFTDYDLKGRKIFLREDREKGNPGAAMPFGVIGEPSAKGAGKGGGKGRGRGRGRGRGGGDYAPPQMDEVMGGTALYVGNLPWSATNDDLFGLFSSYNAKAAQVKMGYDGRSRGYGIVRFDSEMNAQAALALNGYRLGEREIAVRFDRQGSE